MPQKARTERYQVPAVVGAIKVLRELWQRGDKGANQAGLVESTGLSKSTMHNLLATLEENDFVRRDPDTKIYFLGPALIPLGAAATSQVKLLNSTVERVIALAGEYGLSFAVAQRVGELEVQIVDRVYPPSDVHVGITVGSTYGPMDGALGKVILAELDEKRASKVLGSGRLPAHTEASITSPEQLLAEVAEVREAGWATSRGELNANNAVAAGINGQSGDLELVVLALGFPSQLDDKRLEEVGRLLVSVARDVMAEAGVSSASVPSA